ncbi:hypothetical protein L5B97_09650 [Avibacterium sp. 20-15]|uniref:hypothetical protein n=1 Tax=unclassified Avibacterium TaxID=2685287 RepID=UPI0020265CED|nr:MULTISPECIES: hypothetical protein [unclassified Avibacterium]MCW9733719.1 hypothetical protein [Avibacterium sp. 20-15]URL03568.1 hypothetical protein L4F93_08340 [Avibacterium sp. 20-132]
MTKIIIQRSVKKYCESDKVRQLGKAGRRERMFEVSRRVNTQLDFTPKLSRVDRATNFNNARKIVLQEEPPKKRYHQSAILTANAKQKRVCGHRDLI